MAKRRRVWAFLAATSLCFSISMPAAHAEKVSDDEVRKAQAEESQAAKSVADIEVALASLTAEASDLEIAAAEAEVANSQAHSKLRETMDNAEDAQIRADEAQAKVEEGRIILARIGASFYREGASSMTDLAYLLDADSLQEANEKSHAYNMAGGVAKNALEEFKALEAVAQALQKEADRLYEQQCLDAYKAEKAMHDAEEKAQEAQERVKEIDAEREELVTVLAQKQGVARELVAAQRAQKEEEARQAAAAEAERIRQAEEERRKREAEEQKRRQREIDEQNRRQQPPAPTPPPAPAPAPAPNPAPAPAPSGNLGEQIVAYARQYKGVPYVWGGNTTAGWDCSGYTKFVYAHFGITLPRTTYGIEAAGYMPVSRANAKPGDLVLWPGHVGIYTGNGQHIAARSSRKGTVEGPLYGSPHFVRVVNY